MFTLPLRRPKPICSDETARLLEEFNLYALHNGYAAWIFKPHGYPEGYLALRTNEHEEFVTKDENQIQRLLRCCVESARRQRRIPAEERLRMILDRDAAGRELQRLIQEGFAPTIAL